MLLNRRLAIEKMRLAARELARSLTISDRRDLIAPALREKLQEQRELSPHLAELGARYPHEPYRLLLGLLRERLARAVGEVRDADRCATAKDAGGELNRAAVEETLL